MKTILVTGGAGYIGSHASLFLSQQGYKVIVLDRFVYNQIFNHKWAEVIRSDIADTDILKSIFLNNNIDAVMHFAASINVGDSVNKPLEYYENNVSKTVSLLQLMLKYNVRKFIFSSSCAVYGNVETDLITEDLPLKPISPYGKTKFMVEQILEDLSNKINFVSLRYFNAAGALPEFGLGEIHKPETHLIPLLLTSIKNQIPFTIFGNDYDTKDGTCIRDFLHVWDIASAHYLALQYLQNGNPSNYFNLGTGQGCSVKQIIDEAEVLLKTKVNVTVGPRRQGDPAILVADPSKANNYLKWKPQYSDIAFILKSANSFDNSQRIITNLPPIDYL